jgi:hypothetical protein
MCEIIILKFPLRAVNCKTELVEGLCMESIAKDDNYQISPFNFQQAFHSQK